MSSKFFLEDQARLFEFLPESFNEDHDLTPFSSQKGTLELHGHLQPHWLVPPSPRMQPCASRHIRNLERRYPSSRFHCLVDFCCVLLLLDNL
jgi:hypothetical protein